MAWWSKVLPKEDIELDELSNALQQNRDALYTSIREARKSKSRAKDLLQVVEDSLQVLDRVEEKQRNK